MERNIFSSACIASSSYPGNLAWYWMTMNTNLFYVCLHWQLNTLNKLTWINLIWLLVWPINTFFFKVGNAVVFFSVLIPKGNFECWLNPTVMFLGCGRKSGRTHTCTATTSFTKKDPKCLNTRWGNYLWSQVIGRFKSSWTDVPNKTNSKYIFISCIFRLMFYDIFGHLDYFFLSFAYEKQLNRPDNQTSTRIFVLHFNILSFAPLNVTQWAHVY